MSTRDARAGSTGVTARSRRGADDQRQVAATPAPRGEGLVVGTVPALARVTGVLLVVAGLAGLAAPFPTYLVVGGSELVVAEGPADALVALLLPLTHLAVGALLAAGRVPKLGLAYAGVAGALAVGQLLIELYRGQQSTARPGIEVIAGERVLTSGIDVRPGWLLTVVALGLLVVSGALALAAWGRTVMEDGGALDPVRPVVAGAALLLGLLTVLSLTLPAVDVPADLVVDPVTGLQIVVEREGPQALLERPGLALLGGLLLAGAVLLCSVVAPTLRPRLAAVGGLLALAVAVLSAGLTGLRDAAGSPDLEWTVPGLGLLAAGLGYALLTALAWRLRRA